MESIIEKIRIKENWIDFYEHKLVSQSFSSEDKQDIKAFIDEEKFLSLYEKIKRGNFPESLPKKIIINKEGSKKKRVVYSFEKNENIILKFIAYNLYEFDSYFSRGCYAFRRGYGVKDAINRLKGNESFGKMYCFKADISNYFNSIDVERLLDKLIFVKEKDEGLYQLFERMLLENRVLENGKVITENHGAMAGTPCSPFFANVYLSEMDWYFYEKGVEYFRYSDDILIFGKTKEELNAYMDIFNKIVEDNKLTINKEKVAYASPGESFEFLGFSYDMGCIDLSANTLRKMKARIKRKADALRRWQRKKGVSERNAAVGFINAMNGKFYGRRKHMAEETDVRDLTWSRWFFPNITTDKSLKEIDEYMQEYIRYVFTGRHYKGNYRITYEQLKELGYKSLVNEYYSGKNHTK